MNKNLLIIGAGQYGTVINELAREIGSFEKIDFLDEAYGSSEQEENYHELSIGKPEDYESFLSEYSYAIAAVEHPATRRDWTSKLEEAGFCIPILVSPRAYVSPSAQLNKGCVIEPLAGVHANAVVGIGSRISMGAVVDHNSYVADFCHIDCNAVVMSGGFVPCGTDIDAGSVIRREPMMFSIDRDGIHASKMPITPVGDGYSFDDVM